MSSTLTGIATVAGHEFRVRLRTGRWRWLLAAWFLVITAFMVLLRLALNVVLAEQPSLEFGVPMFGGLMLWVLALALLVSPALSAQAINGDRERGTLATLQVTRLTPVEIAGGKLLASWGTLGVFVVLTIPHVVWCIIAGGVGPLRAVTVLAVVVLLCGVVCAIALALSGMLARGVTSSVLSYCVVFALTVGTLVVFGLSSALATEQVERPVQVSDVPPGSVPDSAETREMRTETRTVTRSHPEQVWWTLAPNPFVVLADAAPALPLRRNPVTDEMEPPAFDPLGTIGRMVRNVRTPNGPLSYGSYTNASTPPPQQLPVWPWGLGFDVLLGAGAFALTVRQLRAPKRHLPRGVRIA